MKKSSRRGAEMRKEYDFTGGIRGKYAKRFSEVTNVIVLDPDVAEFFKNSESANRALRALTEIFKEQRKKASA